MGDFNEHLAKAEDALAAAEQLRPEMKHWALVPLFYSAMHLVHATFDYEVIDPSERHPKFHRSAWSGGVRVEWGTNDVVIKRCTKKVATCYRSLYDVGRVVRYDMQPGVVRSDERFWDEYFTVKRYADEVIL